MGYLRLAEFRTSQNRGEIACATKAHKPVTAISQTKPIEKTDTARRAAQIGSAKRTVQNRNLATEAVQGGQCKIDAIRQTVHGEQYKTGGVHGRQCKSANVRRATKRLLL